MKRQNLIFTVVTVSVSVGTAVMVSTIANMTLSQSATAQTGAQSTKVIQVAKQTNMVKTIASGAFVSAEHPTQGMAKIVTENGQRYVEFDRQFKSDNGPDLFVLLHTQAKPTDYASDDYISLGRLQNVSGKQRYAIPADVDIETFKSVVVWCREFNATFGFAPLV